MDGWMGNEWELRAWEGQHLMLDLNSSNLTKYLANFSLRTCYSCRFVLGCSLRELGYDDPVAGNILWRTAKRLWTH